MGRRRRRRQNYAMALAANRQARIGLLWPEGICQSASGTARHRKTRPGAVTVTGGHRDRRCDRDSAGPGPCRLTRTAHKAGGAGPGQYHGRRRASHDLHSDESPHPACAGLASVTSVPGTDSESHCRVIMIRIGDSETASDDSACQ